MVTLSRLYLRGVREWGVPGSPAPSRGSGDESSRSPTSIPLSWGRYPGSALLGLPTYFPAVSGWAGRGARRRAGLARPPALRGPGRVVPASSARVAAPPEPRKLQRAFRRGSEVSRRDGDPQHQPGTRSGRAGLRQRVAASAGALPAPAAGAGAASPSPSPSSIPTCRSPAGHPFPWAGAGPRRRPPHGCA